MKKSSFSYENKWYSTYFEIYIKHIYKNKSLDVSLQRDSIDRLLF